MFRGEKAGKKNKAPSDPQLNYQLRNHSKPKTLCKIYEARNPSLYIKYWKGEVYVRTCVTGKKSSKSDDLR